MVATAATSFESCIVIEIVFNIIAVVKMVADDFTILANYKIPTVGIISSISFFGWCHAKSGIK